MLMMASELPPVVPNPFSADLGIFRYNGLLRVALAIPLLALGYFLPDFSLRSGRWPVDFLWRLLCDLKAGGWSS